MSSEVLDDALRLADVAASDIPVVKLVPPTIRILTKYTAGGYLKRADHYLDATLDLLEATKNMMPNTVHEAHHKEYDRLAETRTKLKPKGIIGLGNRSKCREFKQETKDLHCGTTESSKQARSFRIKLVREAREAARAGGPLSEMGSEDNLCEILQNSAGPRRRDDRSTTPVSMLDPFRETDSTIVRDGDSYFVSEHDATNAEDVDLDGELMPSSIHSGLPSSLRFAHEWYEVRDDSALLATGDWRQRCDSTSSMYIDDQ